MNHPSKRRPRLVDRPSGRRLLTFVRNRPSARSGMALVITLALVVLMTFLVIAFFSSTAAFRGVENTSTGGVVAHILAEGAVDAIQVEFIQEMVAGSIEQAVGSGATASRVLVPKERVNMVPTRAISSNISDADPNFFNLVKQSGLPFFPEATIFNSTSSDDSTKPAANGRRVSERRWDTPMLHGAAMVSGQTPRWIYVTPDGYTNTPSDNVIGRVAFNVYDIGGLLNANAAGFAPKNSGGDPDEMISKGPVVWADLRALPGINLSAYGRSDAWPPKWRVTGDWASFTSDATNSSLPYYLRTGWRNAYLNAGGAASDRMFASRQDLIRYAKAQPGTFAVADTGTDKEIITALQYLTTFSRDIERPSFRPAVDRPKVQTGLAGGGNDAQGSDDQINPSLLTEEKAGGGLAVPRRFPLSRLKLVATPIPPASPTGAPTEIRDYFGLQWDASNNWWTYDHGSPNSILRLSQVPASRDPDFVELLKAALTVGGLGKQFGFTFPQRYIGTRTTSEVGGQDGRVEDQIIQIAANIIDQADPDSYPTRIRFAGRTFHGIEDLPRIYRGHESSWSVGVMPLFKYPAVAAPNAELYVTMIYPELWNPHRPSPSPAGPAPADFRVVADSFTPLGGEMKYFWTESGQERSNPGNDDFFSDFSRYPSGAPVPGGPNCSSLIAYQAGEGGASTSANAALTFNVAGAGEASFREPRPLSAVGYPVGSNANGTVNGPDMSLTALVSPDQPDTIVSVQENVVPAPINGGAEFKQALGFVASYLPCGKYGNKLWLMRGRGGPVRLELQYRDPSNPSRWWTFDRMEVAYQNHQRGYDSQSHVVNRLDPRTDRWGPFYSLPTDVSSASYRYHTGQTANPSVSSFPVKTNESFAEAPGWTGISDRSTNAQMGQLQQNKYNTPVRYTDPDGVQRGAAAKYAAGTRGWPMITGNTNSRPVVLNRPFRSVAELGNVFRDTPWRELDFASPQSADRALLDVFTVEEVPEDGIVAARVNLNTRQVPVIKALLQSAGMVAGAKIENDPAQNAAEKLTEWTASSEPSKGPLSDRSEIVGRFVSGTTFAGPLDANESVATDGMADQLPTAEKSYKASREAITRALVDAGTTGSWNLFVDVIAQSGQISAGGQFIPQGESRIWNAFALDRFTGEIIEQFTETVQE